MGDRAIPEGNPILVEKERKRLRQVHLSRLRKTRPTIDTSLPKGFSKKKGGGLVRKKNLKPSIGVSNETSETNLQSTSISADDTAPANEGKAGDGVKAIKTPERDLVNEQAITKVDKDVDQTQAFDNQKIK